MCIYLSLLSNLHHFASSREEQREGKGSVLLRHQGGMDFIFFECLPINVWIHNTLRFRGITICCYCGSSLHDMQCTDFDYVLFLFLLMKKCDITLKKNRSKKISEFWKLVECIFNFNFYHFSNSCIFLAFCRVFGMWGCGHIVIGIWQIFIQSPSFLCNT